MPCKIFAYYYCIKGDLQLCAVSSYDAQTDRHQGVHVVFFILIFRFSKEKAKYIIVILFVLFALFAGPSSLTHDSITLSGEIILKELTEEKKKIAERERKLNDAAL